MVRIQKQKEALPGITEVRPGVFRIRVKKKDPRTGTNQEVSRRVECSLSEAVRLRAELAAEIEDVRARTAHAIKLADFVDSWLSTRLPRLKPSTRARYARDLDVLMADLGAFYLDALDQEDIERWLAERAKKYAPATLNGYLRVLKTVLADAAARYRIPDPAARIRAFPERPSLEEGPRNLLTATEVRTFLDLLRGRWPQWYAMTFTQLVTARRFGEVSALRWEDIDDDQGVIRIRRAHWQGHIGTPKTDRAVVVPLLDQHRRVLGEWREYLETKQPRQYESGWVFPSRAGKPHHSSVCMRKAFEDELKEMGVARSFSSHGLRRTANDLLRRVASGEIVRAITGHVTEQMTEHYSHVDVEEKRTAASDMLRLIQGGTGKPARGTVARAAKTEAHGGEGDRVVTRVVTDPSKVETRRPGRPLASRNRLSSSNFSERVTGVEPATFSLGTVQHLSQHR